MAKTIQERETKDLRYGEYPKYMPEDSLTKGLGRKTSPKQTEVGYLIVCKEYGSLMQDNGIKSPIR